MLVISRKLEESIIINGNIEIVVIGMEDGKVKLGIEAPKDIKIYRKEIYESIKKENQDAIKTDKNFLYYLPHKK